jgi:antitoxin (DNA-binding transcriptional repressor) of toxin-antitoxin stability system
VQVNATQFRANVYKLLDRVLLTREPLDIVRKGQRLRIVPADAPRAFSIENLEPHPDGIVGDPDELIHMDWSSEWKPFI